MAEKQIATTEATGTVAVRDETLAGLLERPEYRNRFRDVLGQRAGEFMSSVLSLQMHTMRDVEPKSILGAAMTAASLNLPINPNLGFAYIIAYADKNRGGKKYAQFQIGYKGFVQLAMRTGKYRFMNTCRIFEGELVKYDKLTGELTIDEDKKSSEKIIGYASFFKLVNGFEHSLYMSAEQVVAHGKQYSQSFKKGYGQWVDNFEAMALKTVLKLNLSKWGVLSVEMERAFYEDQGVKHEVDADTRYLDNDETTFPTPQIEAPKGTDTPEPPTETPVVAPEPTEKPADKPAAPKKKEEKKKTPPAKLTVMPPPAATKAPVEEKAANAREVGPNETALVAKVNEAGYLFTDFLWLAVFQQWLPAPEGYDGDPADLQGMTLPEEKLETFLEPDNFGMVVEQMAKKKAEGDKYPVS